MEQLVRVIDYIIEQANIYDTRNLQFEQDILFLLKREKDKLDTRIMSFINDDISTLLKMEKLMMRIDDAFKSYTNYISKVVSDKFMEHYNTGYSQTGDLIQLGNEVNQKLSQNVSELQRRQYDPESIDFLKKHAFELLKGHSFKKVEELRATLGNMYLNGNVDKAAVRNNISKILEVNKSKAEEIAQTELSRAYNYGTMARLTEYQKMNPGEHVRKYWHGFKYSKITCSYCRPRIGMVYNIEDDIEVLPAHVRCRCVWLPILGGWDSPVSPDITRRANMLKAVYSPEQIYSRINSRLNIKYGEFIDPDMAAKYIGGDRSEGVMQAIGIGRDAAISSITDKYDIAIDRSSHQMSKEFNSQMSFWKNLTARAMVDNDRDLLDRCREAIKGVMVLPWSADQLTKWNELLYKMNNI